jgi:hypothetical protein
LASKPEPSYAEPAGGSEGSSIARDICARQERLEEKRRYYEDVWLAVAEYCAPDAPEFLRYGFADKSDNQVSRSDRRTRRTYDTTVRVGQRRLAAGLESLITPQNEKWHGLTTAMFNDEETDEEKEWGESLRDFLFGLRYSAATGYVPSMQQVYANIIRFGPAYLYMEEDNTGRHVRYASIPVSEGWVARNRWGEPDTFHRLYKRSARQCAQHFGEKLPQKIKDMARDPKKCDEQVEIIHAIYPNNDRKTINLGDTSRYIDGPYKSCHVIKGEEYLVRERTYNAFPVSCFNWARDDGDDYGTSPVIEMLTEVREINVVKKDALRMVQQMGDPAIGHHSKIDDVPPLDAGARLPGMIDEQGRPLFAPMNTGMRPDWAFQYIEKSQQNIQEGLYVNLFQVLASKPGDQTATEALIRQEEKGALLGPAGSSIQAGLSMQVDRELSILEAQGIYEEGSRFVPPETLGGKNIRPNFTSPLDIMRKAGEARATVEAVGFATSVAAVAPDILDNIDFDEALRTVHGAGRAPQKILKRREEVEEARKAKAAAAQAQQGLAGAAAMAGIAKDAVPAMAQAAQAGMLPGLAQQAPAQ